MSRQQFFHILKHTAAIGPGRAYGENLIKPFFIQGRTYPGVSKDSLGFGGKDDFLSPDHIEQGFDACPVTEQAQTVFGSVQDGNGKNAVETFYKVRSEFHITC